MAYSVDWITKIITIPTTDLVLVSGDTYNLPMQEFLAEVRRLEWDPSEGLWAPAIMEHTNSKPNFAGASYAGFDSVINGYTITVIGSATRVNITGSNNNLIDVLNVTGVSLVPTNSAGLQDLSVLLASAYQGQVVLSPSRGQAGTATPIGTFFKPSNNMDDTISIGEINGIENIILTEHITINEDLSAGFNLIGTSPFNIATIAPVANLVGVSILNLTVQGELDGLNTVRDSSLMAVTNVSGFIEKCAFLSSISLTGDTLIAECYSNIPGAQYPTLINSPGCKITVRDFHGSIGLINITDTFHSIQGGGGRCVIEPSCTGGTIHVRGTWFEIVDNSSPGCTVLDERDNMEIRDNVISIASNTQI